MKFQDKKESKNNKKNKRISFKKRKNYSKNNLAKNNKKKGSNVRGKFFDSSNLRNKKQLPQKKQKTKIKFQCENKKLIGRFLSKNDFCYKATKYFGPQASIKSLKQAKQKIVKQLRQLNKIIQFLEKKQINIFSTIAFWKNNYFINQNQQLDHQKMSKIRKVMFHMQIGMWKFLYLETKIVSSLIMFTHIKLQNLTCLHIQDTVISLQPLIWMDCPLLRYLTITNSDIVNIKALDKCNWKNLISLSLNDNKIPTANFERIRMKRGSHLQVFQILQPLQYLTPEIQEEIGIQDIRVIARSEAQSIGITKKQVLFRNRIPQLKVLNYFISRSVIGWEDQLQYQRDQYL